MSNDKPRQPAGVPTGGQYAASVKSESGVGLGDDFAAPRTEAETLLDGPARAAMSTRMLLSAGSALRAETIDDSSDGFHLGVAQSEAEAFWLLQRPEVPPAHETAWSANEFIEGTLDPATGTAPGHAAQQDFAANLGPYVAMSAEHGAAISDHFMVRAIAAADQTYASGPHINDTPGRTLSTYPHGVLHASCENAVRFRTGREEPSSEEVRELSTYLRERAAERAQLPSRAHSEPTAQEGREIYDEVFAFDYDET